MARLLFGTSIDRRYVLVRAIGQGGVSTVYAAVDAADGRERAVKILGSGSDARREAVLTDRLRHPSVPRVFAYGQAPLPDGTVAPYLVLELLRGRPLTERLTGGPLPWRSAARIAAATADVLAVAHRRGVAHRDLSARNVMLTPTGPKIIDFGLARPVDSPGPATDGSGRVGPVDWPDPVADGFGRTRLGDWPGPVADDVYTLGVLLYEMVTGRSPYPPAVAATIRVAGRTAHLAPTPVLAVPGLPSRLRDLVRDCMAKTPRLRPTAREAARDLWSLLDTPKTAPLA
ncbi:serine/threonine-protein kinase [Actinoplanes sp. NPDC049265]|uniref:serine/threonine-protein kinase n=1 Tax=Actinoplanes sp. NPDC049265 TaxID=3363902 RepID=UPI0037101E8F